MKEAIDARSQLDPFDRLDPADEFELLHHRLTPGMDDIDRWRFGLYGLWLPGPLVAGPEQRHEAESEAEDPATTNPLHASPRTSYGKKPSTLLGPAKV